jgi:hypothetical protein
MHAIAANIVRQGGIVVGLSGTVGGLDGPSAVAMNTTVADGTANGYLAVYAATLPLVSNLNYSAGKAVGNLTTVKNLNQRAGHLLQQHRDRGCHR